MTRHFLTDDDVARRRHFLTDDDMARRAPAIFATAAHETRSSRYAYVPTVDILHSMRREGFYPTHVSQAKTRNSDKAGHTKHLIRFRREVEASEVEAREVILLNSHDGSSGAQLMAGVFRFACANGLIVGQSDTEVKVRHSGNALGDIIDGAYTVVTQFDQVSERIDAMKCITLTPERRHTFANAALQLRYDDVHSCGLQASQLLRARRSSDTNLDLWSTFNCVQENMLRGGQHGAKYGLDGRRRRMSSRAINGIDQNVALNRGLWVLAEAMGEVVDVREALIKMWGPRAAA